MVPFEASDTFQKELEPAGGYIGSVEGSIKISATIVFVVCLFVKLPRLNAIAISALLPPNYWAF